MGRQSAHYPDLRLCSRLVIMMENPLKNYTLGNVEASEQLIHDLYIDLRKKANLWSSITHQTAQARMGYVGQHLVSVATGFPGGRSGARGKDLILPDKEFAEIKTCYRVDQLGRCNNCQAVVSSIEEVCPDCESADIKRNDDSKWLIGIRHDAEFASILDPKYYYLVLFDFTDLAVPDTVRSSIWRVDSTAPGFSYCMIDYYANIRAASASKAPFNLWPFSFKFDLMRPTLIYRSFVLKDDVIETEIFPGRDAEVIHTLQQLSEYARLPNLTRDKILAFGKSIGTKIKSVDNKRNALEELQKFVDQTGIPQPVLVDKLAEAFYLPNLVSHIPGLPRRIGERSGLYRA